MISMKQMLDFFQPFPFKIHSEVFEYLNGKSFIDV